jgi:hypothetical protein
MTRIFALVSLLVLAVCAVWCAPAWAHPAIETTYDQPAAAPAAAPVTAVWSAAHAPRSVPWAAALAAAAAMILGWRRPRRALALGIVLILAVFAFENGVHSVHHLGGPRHLNDLRSGATCAVAAATLHVNGTTVDGAALEHVVSRSEERLAVRQRPSFDTLSLAAHQGRAPPISA